MTRLVLLALFLAHSQLAARAGDPPQPEDSVLATYDLRAVLPRWDASAGWSQTLLVPPAASPRQELPSIDGTHEYGDLAAFELLDLLTQILGDELRREDRELLVEGSVLTVLAPPNLQEEVRSILEGLEMALAGTIPLRVDVLTLPEGGEPVRAGAMPEEEAAKLVAALVGRGAQHRSHVLEISAGRTARLDAHRRIPFLFDYDVEIAQSIMVFAPVTSETSEGTSLALRGLPVSGGVLLSTVLLRSELLGKIQEQPLVLKGKVNHIEGGKAEVIEGPRSIQSPEVLVRGLAFDTFLPDGKALALTLECTLGAARTREVVLLRRMGGSMSAYVARPIPRTNRTLIALDAELFRAPRLTTDARPWADERGTFQPSAVAHFDGEVSGFLLEWLKARFSIWRRFGPWILIVTDPAWDRDAAAQLDRLVKSLQPDTTLLDVGVDLRAQGREAAFPVRLRMPLLAGSSAGLVLGRGETAVTGFDVEVAQGAAVPDPYVSSVFEGLCLALSVEGTTCEASGMAQLLDYPIAALDPGYDVLGPLERPEPRVLRFDERLKVPTPRRSGAPDENGRAGLPLRIGSASDRPDQPGLTVEITISSALR